MTINYLEGLIKRDKHQRGIPEYNHTEGYVDYAMGEWLFDMQFNYGTETYFHNVSEYEDYPEGSPEYSQWLGREDNWEMCGVNYFHNYPDNFVIRYRFARPSYIEVLRWFSQNWGAKIKYGAHMSKIYVSGLKIPTSKNEYVIESVEVKLEKPLPPIALAKRTIDVIMARLWLAGYEVPHLPRS